MLINVDEICLPKEASVMEAVLSLNASGKGVVLVCGEGKILLGTVTDADIRHGLASNIPLEGPVERVMRKDPSVVQAGLSRSAIRDEFIRTGLRAVPEIDANGRVVECYFRDNFSSFNIDSSTLMIMAGGFGKRMGTLTKERPKPLLEVRGKPMIQHIIELAVSENLNQIIISTHHMSEMIEEYCGDGSKFGAEIRYIKEDQPLGTGGSFGLLTEISGPIVVTNADIMSTVGYRQMIDYHVQHKALATMAVREHQMQHPFGVILNAGVKLVGFQEKPVWKTNINAGIYVLDASVRRFITSGEPVDMPEVIEKARDAGETVVVYPLHEGWTDLGSEADYSRYR